MDSVHGSWTSSGVAGPRVHCGLPPLPQRLAARVETGQARHGATEGPLTRARMTVKRRRTDGGASVPNGYSASAIEEGRRKCEGVRCSTEVWGSFYRAGREAGAAGNRGRRR
jgi:hypothetical protein